MLSSFLRPCAECNCLPFLKKAWKGNVFLAADGYRYNVQMDLMEHEVADPQKWSIQLWDMHPDEEVMVTHRFLQWQEADGNSGWVSGYVVECG